VEGAAATSAMLRIASTSVNRAVRSAAAKGLEGAAITTNGLWAIGGGKVSGCVPPCDVSSPLILSTCQTRAAMLCVLT
jgi:hypothetical protein